jgi:hypothetical protein
MTEKRSQADSDASGGGVSKLRQRWPKSVRVTIGLILYVYSIGPMFWFWYEAENMGGNPLVRVIYVPLRLFCVIPQVEDWLNNYINWWIA